MRFLLGLIASGMDKQMLSPPFIKVAVEATTSFTVTYFFLSAFFKADFVNALMKTPTPYSCSRIGEGMLGAICVSEVLIAVLLFASVLRP